MDLVSMLVGAGIGFVCSLVGSWINHHLRLREDEVKRERENRRQSQDVRLPGPWRDQVVEKNIETLREAAKGIQGLEERLRLERAIEHLETTAVWESNLSVVVGRLGVLQGMVGDLTDPELREDTWLDLWAATTADCPEEASLLKLLIEALSLKIERAKEVGNFSEAHKMEELRSKIERKYGGSKDSRKDCE